MNNLEKVREFGIVWCNSIFPAFVAGLRSTFS